MWICHVDIYEAIAVLGRDLQYVEMINNELEKTGHGFHKITNWSLKCQLNKSILRLKQNVALFKKIDIPLLLQ